MQFLIKIKNKYLMHLIVFEPVTSREEVLVKERPATCGYGPGRMEKERSGTVASDVAI